MLTPIFLDVVKMSGMTQACTCKILDYLSFEDHGKGNCTHLRRINGNNQIPSSRHNIEQLSLQTRVLCTAREIDLKHILNAGTTQLVMVPARSPQREAQEVTRTGVVNSPG